MKTYQIVLLSVLLSLVASGGVVFVGSATPESPQLHYCPENGLAANCIELGSYVSPVGKCYLSEADQEMTGKTYKICRSGWQKVENDVDLVQTDEPVFEKVYHAGEPQAKQYKCGVAPNGCVQIR